MIKSQTTVLALILFAFAFVASDAAAQLVQSKSSDPPKKISAHHLQRLYRQLKSGNPGDAPAKIANAKGDRALELIRRWLPKEENALARYVLMQPLSNSDTDESIAMLVRIAIEDPDDKNRQQARVFLKRLPTEKASVITESLNGYLKRKQFVSRAAQLLRQGTFTNDASVPLLIPRLNHEGRTAVPAVVNIPTDRCISPTGFVRTVRLLNVETARHRPSVYAALKSYTHQDFGYDEGRWRGWLARAEQLEGAEQEPDSNEELNSEATH